MQLKNITLYLTVLLTSCASFVYGQNIEFKRNSLKTGIAFGFNEGETERGLGIIYSIGLQKSFGKKQKLRLNPNLMIGGFVPFGITDTPNQFYRITTLGYNLHYDIMKYKAVSFVTSIGPFASYSRGLLGTGGDGDVRNSHSIFFNSFYFGGNVSIGLRIDFPKRKIAYEIRPINGMVGNNYFTLGYFLFGMDFKFKN
ncbi:hypothetical protein M3P19_00180 [Muricauda sp. 2012CJ35-5]|uniref:Outer membrane protein beta-barrel domain-containing protein n=1 Tax=Flagellimonas spongiicola TaxID=2942208 RepID=A0ABT0PLZ5_9FLAO|nr:hypothetical protein [Allomuricauda spongiicola]MCL6272399.1 hypothetical protein [Allomuricauda spongiicola]